MLVQFFLSRIYCTTTVNWTKALCWFSDAKYKFWLVVILSISLCCWNKALSQFLILNVWFIDALCKFAYLLFSNFFHSFTHRHHSQLYHICWIAYLVRIIIKDLPTGSMSSKKTTQKALKALETSVLPFSLCFFFFFLSSQLESFSCCQLRLYTLSSVSIRRGGCGSLYRLLNRTIQYGHSWNAGHWWLRHHQPATWTLDCGQIGSFRPHFSSLVRNIKLVSK